MRSLITSAAAISYSLVLAYPNGLLLHQQRQLLQQPGLIHIDTGLHFDSTLRDVLLANQIIPQVLDDFEPSYYIQLDYPQSHEQVLLGNDIPVQAVKKRPTFTFHSLTDQISTGHGQHNTTFTLILTDPDALSREHPVKSEMCHWIITNLTTPIDTDGELAWPQPWLFANDEDQDSLLDPEIFLETEFQSLAKPGEMKPYMPPSPPKKTGPHRYVFVLLEGDTSHASPPTQRPHWGYGKERHGVRDWAAENKLKIVGVNFFYAQHKTQ